MSFFQNVLKCHIFQTRDLREPVHCTPRVFATKNNIQNKVKTKIQNEFYKKTSCHYLEQVRHVYIQWEFKKP